MAKYEYYESAQFAPIAQQRPHDDRYVKEVIMLAAKLDLDFSDFILEDVLNGNTKTLRNFEKANKLGNFQTTLIDGSRYKVHPAIPIENDLYPCIPLKDDESGAGGYAAKPKDDPKRKDVEKALGYLGMDLEELSKQVLNPEPIPLVYIGDLGNIHDLGEPEGTYTDEWAKNYGNVWKTNPSIRETYGSERLWRITMNKDWNEQQKNIQDLTDIHVGMYATAGTLDESNIVAVYDEYQRLLPKLTFRGYNDIDIKDYPPQSYIMEYRSAFTSMVCGMKGWTHIIRNGIVRNKHDSEDNRETYNKKSNVNFYYGSRAVRDDSAGDPINRVIRSDPAWQKKIRITEGIAAGGGLGALLTPTTLIEFQVQLTRGTNPTYGEIRMWNYETAHVITRDDSNKTFTIKGGVGGFYSGRDGGPAGGDKAEVITINEGDTTIKQFQPSNALYSWNMDVSPDGGIATVTDRGLLTFNSPATPGRYFIKIAVHYGPGDEASKRNYRYLEVVVLKSDGTAPPTEDNPFSKDTDPDHLPDDEDYEDIVVFFFGREATKFVPVFKRERLIRETTMLGIYAVKKVKLKWYQNKWVGIVIMIVGLIITILTEGAFLPALKAFLVASAIGLAVSIVIKILSQFIDNPFIIAALIVVVGVITGYVDTANMMNLIQFAMDITTVAIKEYMTQKMEEIAEKAKEFGKMAKDLQEEQDKMMEEVGMMRVDSWEYLKQMLVVPDVEMPGEAMDRSLDVGRTLETHIPAMVDVEALWDSIITQMK